MKKKLLIAHLTDVSYCRPLGFCWWAGEFDLRIEVFLVAYLWVLWVFGQLYYRGYLLKKWAHTKVKKCAKEMDKISVNGCYTFIRIPWRANSMLNYSGSPSLVYSCSKYISTQIKFHWKIMVFFLCRIATVERFQAWGGFSSFDVEIFSVWTIQRWVQKLRSLLASLLEKTEKISTWKEERLTDSVFKSWNKTSLEHI